MSVLLLSSTCCVYFQVFLSPGTFCLVIWEEMWMNALLLSACNLNLQLTWSMQLQPLIPNLIRGMPSYLLELRPQLEEEQLLLSASSKCYFKMQGSILGIGSLDSLDPLSTYCFCCLAQLLKPNDKWIMLVWGW